MASFCSCGFFLWLAITLEGVLFVVVISVGDDDKVLFVLLFDATSVCCFESLFAVEMDCVEVFTDCVAICVVMDCVALFVVVDCVGVFTDCVGLFVEF